MKPRSPDVNHDQLIDLLLQVARRADAIARGQAKMPGLDLHCWLMAEREVLGNNSFVTATRGPALGLAPSHP